MVENQIIYFDNASTTPLTKEVADAMHRHSISTFGNPSSLHGLGREAKKLIKEAREFFAKKINANSEEIVFVNNATEANNMVFLGMMPQVETIIMAPFEHPSVLEAAKATRKKIIYLSLSEEGFIDLKELEAILKKTLQDKKNLTENNSGFGKPEGKILKNKVLVSVMHGNNEIGTVNDIEAIGELCKKYNVYFHSDCVQTFCKLDIDVERFDLDFVSVSAHKIHGPKGIGFLYKRSGINIEPIIFGGGQENDLKPGTENVVSVIGFAEAVKTYGDVTALKNLQRKLIDALLTIPGIELNGPKDLEKRVPGNVNVSVPKFNSEQMVLQLDLKNICASSGSACSSSKMANIFSTMAGADGEAKIISSYVLRACNVAESRAGSALRLSLSKLNTEAEIEGVITAIKQLLD